jgi:hypothetical protein
MRTIFKRLLFSFAATVTTLSAQEAWLLEMPNKYSDYLIKKAVSGDYDTVSGIVAKFPDLITRKQIREIELMKWQADSGKINKKREITEDGRTYNAGVRYYSISGQKPDHRRLKITAPVIERNISIDTYGLIPREWTPTFAHRGETLTTVLLERHAESPSSTVSLGHLRQLEYDAGAAKESVTWYSADPLDTIELYYTSETGFAANPKVKFNTKIFSSVKEDGNSLLRIEASSQDPTKVDFVTLHHNEANFEGHSETTGPLKKETIKIADKTYTKEGEEGAWTLTLKKSE